MCLWAIPKSERCHVNGKPRDRIAVRLDLLDGKRGNALAPAGETRSPSGCCCDVDSQHPESSRFVDGGELAEALACPRCTRNKFHTELHGTTGNAERRVIRLGAGMVFLFGDRTHVVTVK